MHDELLQRLSAARPAGANDPVAPDEQLLEEILTTVPTSPRRRLVTPRRASLVAVAAAVVAALLVLPGETTRPPSAHPTLRMQRIVASTTTALRSGRAHVVLHTTTDKQNHPVAAHSGADFTVEFNGDDRSMYGTVDPGDPCVGTDVSVPEERCGAQPFPIANRVVARQFFLQDGTRWVRDTNASDTAGGDIFSVDPRNFLAGVADAAHFEQVGTDDVAGVTTRHLRATKLDAIPDFNLGLGPRGDVGLTAFELWVDGDDVVRALRVATRQTQQSYAGARATIVDGKKVIDRSTLGEPTRVTITSEYKVDFRDLGQAVAISAPPGAVDIAGKG